MESAVRTQLAACLSLGLDLGGRMSELECRANLRARDLQLEISQALETVEPSDGLFMVDFILL